MPFNKRKKARESAVNELRIQAEEKFLGELEKAADTKEPVKKIFALKKVHDDIDLHLAGEQSIMNQEASLSGTKARASTLLTSGTTGIAGCLLMSTGPVGFAIYGAGMAGVLGAGIAGDLGKKRKLKKLLESAASHAESMEILKASAMATIGETVENNVTAVSKSSSYTAILKIPGITDKFAAAARQHIAEEAPAVEESKEEAAAKPQQPVKKLILGQPK